MSTIKSFSVGNGDMFYIDHNFDSLTIIDCSLSTANRQRIVSEIGTLAASKNVTRFISTHPDEDHICGLAYLDDHMELDNFYVVPNGARKHDVTLDFARYCALRDSAKAFYISKGCLRAWLNVSDEVRNQAGISVLWPDTGHPRFKLAAFEASLGSSPNNISPIIKYSVDGGPTALWMGDLETDFMEAIKDYVDWPHVDILFAPHHGRDSGRVPQSILKLIRPGLVVIGEAPADHLNYYPECNTITQNSAGDITFECVQGWTHVYSSNFFYKSSCLTPLFQPDKPDAYYVGSFLAHAAVAAA